MSAEMIRQIHTALTGVNEAQDGALTARCSFDPDFCGFAGHFPGAPIVPALVQLLLAREVISLRQGPVDVAALRGAKFKRPLRPQEQIEICCRPQAVGKSYKVLLAVEGDPASSFTLMLK